MRREEARINGIFPPCQRGGGERHNPLINNVKLRVLYVLLKRIIRTWQDRMREQKQTKLFPLTRVSARCQNFINADYDGTDNPPTQTISEAANYKTNSVKNYQNFHRHLKTSPINSKLSHHFPSPNCYLCWLLGSTFIISHCYWPLSIH